VLERLAALTPSDVAVPDAGELEELVDDINHVDGPTDAPSRFIVVVGDPEGQIELAGSLADVLRIDEVTEELDPCGDRAGWGGEASPEEAGQQLAEHMAQIRRSIASIGVCDIPELAERLEITFGEEIGAVDLPELLPFMSDVACDPGAAARDDYPYGDTVDLILTPEEMAVWNRFNDGRSEEIFNLHLAIGPSAPIKAAAHFRGQGSMGCARKSLNIALESEVPIPLAPRVATKEMHLISMCLDDGYFQQNLAYRLMQRRDLFPLEFRYVEVRLNGVSRGVYLLIEKPTHTVRDAASSMDRVVRRRTGNGVAIEAELEYPNVDTREEADVLLTEFHELAALVETTAPDLLLDVLSSRFDFDNYLRWIAFNSIVRNGDYVDETFFYGSNELIGDGGVVLYFRNLGWDHDDLDSACHYGGAHAVVDPFGIVYCAEDQIDRSLILSDAVYARFIDHLVEMKDESLTEEIFAAEIERVREDLFAVLDNDEACAAMIELTSPPPATPTCPDVQFEIERRMEVLRLSLSSRFFVLDELVEAYRAAP
jgi:hypothetical protein